LCNIEKIVYNFDKYKSDNDIDSSLLSNLHLIGFIHSRHHPKARNNQHDDSSKEGKYLEKGQYLKE
jgi:hypothetical protein